MSSTFDAVLSELREDFTGQPRDQMGRFASTGGGLMSGVEGGSPAEGKTVKKSGGWNVTKAIAGAGLSVAAGVGVGVGAAALYDQAKKRGKGKVGEPATTAEPPKPTEVEAEAKLVPPTDRPTEGDDQESRLNRIIDQLTKGKSATGGPDKPPETEASKKLREGIEAYAKKRSKGTVRKPVTEDSFDWVISTIHLDFDEQKHPRDGRGRFAKKASSGGRFMSAVAGEPGEPAADGNGNGKPSDGLDDLSIRDLKQLARDNQVNGYSNMTKAELAQAIRAVKANPKQQQRIRETLRKKSEARKVVGNTEAAKFLRDFDKMTKIIRASGVSPELAAIALGAFLAKKGQVEWQKQRKEYQSFIPDSATDAAARARTIPVDDFSDKPNVVFAVGGYRGMGSTGKEIADEFTREENENSDWFRDNAHFIPIENSEYNVRPIMPKKLPGGVTNPAYLAEAMIRSGGNMVKQRRRKRNDQAVELAAQIYAHAIARGFDETGKKRVNADVPITIVTHGAGGSTVDEALAILRSQNMRLPDAEAGTDIIDRIQVVKLGSSNLGLADPPDRKKNPISMRTFTSSKDPFSFLPKTNETWKSDVPGGEIKDYMRTESIRTEFLNAMGYDPNTYRSAKTAADTEKKRKEREARKNRGRDEGGGNSAPSSSSPPPSSPPPSSPPKPKPSGGGSPSPAGGSSPDSGAAKARVTESDKPPSKKPAGETKAAKEEKERASRPQKDGYVWIKKEGHPEGGYFRKAPQKKSDAFDWALLQLGGA